MILYKKDTVFLRINVEVPHFCIMKSAVLLVFLLFSFDLYSQELFFKDLPFQFYSPSRACFVVTDGEEVYTSRGCGQEWVKSAIHFAGDLNGQELKSDYFPMSTSKGDYFVRQGCGEVWQLLGDSLVRIDHSFQHRNQYGASTFVYRDTLFMTGGYGFFVTKNITTYFDFATGGWFLKHTHGPYPPDRCGAHTFQSRDKIYFWGGQERNTLGDDTLQSLWSLDLISSTWRNEGKICSEIGLPLMRSNATYAAGENWVHMGNRMLQFDADSLKVREYQADRFYQLKGWVPHEDEWLIVEWGHNENEFLVQIKKRSDVLGDVKKEYGFIDEQQYRNAATLSLWAVVLFGWLIGVLGYYWVLLRRSKRQDLEMGEQLSQAEWSDRELAILEIFWAADSTGIEVSELNVLFNYGDPNFDTLKKRRELKLKDLRKKLAQLMGISESEVYVEQRLNSDRRVKKMALHPDIKRETLGIPLK